MKTTRKKIKDLGKKFEYADPFERLGFIVLNPIETLVISPFLLLSVCIMAVSLLLIPFIGFYKMMGVAILASGLFGISPLLQVNSAFQGFLERTFIS